jgi:hypothetical protein
VLLLNLLCSISVAMFTSFAAFLAKSSTELLRESDREGEKGCIDQLNASELTSFSVTGLLFMSQFRLLYLVGV